MKSKATIFCLVLMAGAAIPVAAQTQTGSAGTVDRASSYYHYSMGHLFSELAGQYGNRGEYVNEAIDHYRQALEADPNAAIIAEELADLYVQGGKITDGIREYEAVLAKNPNDLNAHRVLGRIYMRLTSDTQRVRVSEENLGKATDHFEKIVQLQPGDVDAWLTLGRLYQVGQKTDEAEKAFSKALDLDPENDDAMTGLAVVYTSQGQAQKASDLLKQVAEKKPSLQTLVALAETYEQMRDYDLASQALQRATEFAPDNAELTRMLALDLTLAEKFDDALKLYKQMVADDPKDVDSLLRMSQIYREQKNFDDAQKTSDQAKAAAPDSLQVLYNEVRLLEAEGKNAEAIAAMTKVLDATSKRTYNNAEKSNRAQLLEELGLLYRNNEQYPQAVQTFRDLGALDPENLGARSAAQVAETYRQGKDYQKAIDEAEASLKKYPDDTLIRQIYASALADSGKIDPAVAEMKKLIDGKNDQDTWVRIAQLYERGKRYSDMGKALDQAEKLSDSDDQKEMVHFLRGAMYERMKDLDKSEAEFRKVLAVNPESASALNYLGYMLADSNMKLNEALDMIQKAVNQEPDNPAYLDSLGWVYFRMGRLDQAEEFLRKAVAQSASDPTMHDHLGDIYAKQGKLKDALSTWETALKLWNQSPALDQDSQEIAKIQKKVDSARVKLAKESGSRQ